MNCKSRSRLIKFSWITITDKFAQISIEIGGQRLSLRKKNSPNIQLLQRGKHAPARVRDGKGAALSLSRLTADKSRSWTLSEEVMHGRNDRWKHKLCTAQRYYSSCTYCRIDCGRGSNGMKWLAVCRNPRGAVGNQQFLTVRFIGLHWGRSIPFYHFN